MVFKNLVDTGLKRSGLGLLLCAACSPLFAAGNSLTTPDSNSYVVVENAVVRDGDTTLLFWTYPDVRDPNAGKPCPLNFYTLKLQPGLPAAQAELAAGKVCGSGLSRAGLLSNGDVVIIAGDRLERWHAGKQRSSQPLDSVQATQGLGVDTASGGQMYDFDPSGSVVLGIPKGGAKQQDFSGICAFPDVCIAVAGMDAQGNQRWRSGIEQPGQRTELQGIWASSRGGALVRVATIAQGGTSLAVQEYLYFIDARGSSKMTAQIAHDDQPDIQQVMQSAQAGGLEQAYAMLGGAAGETIEKLDAAARSDGGFDVLLQRKGGDPDRTGHFLLRLAPNGEIRSETALTNLIDANGLENWTDFTTSGNELVLLSRVVATQAEIQARRKVYGQNVITRIDTANRTQVARLVPLDRHYLQAAMNAGDEDIQFLENLPGGDPVRLTAVAGKPVAVSLGKISRKTALRFDEDTDDLARYSEFADQREAEADKERLHQQRRTERQASQKQMNADMAASVGMTPEQFNVLSKREQKEILMRKGDLNALMAGANRQAQAMQDQQTTPTTNAQNTTTQAQDMKAQMAAVMAQVQQQAMQGTGNPAIDAQIQASLAQMQQAMQGQGFQMPGTGTQATSGMPPDPAALPAQSLSNDDTLQVNANRQGLVEFRNRDGNPTTLLIFDRDSGQELLRKSFPDGTIHELVDFGKFRQPLDRIGIMFLDVSGLILEDLTPVVSP